MDWHAKAQRREEERKEKKKRRRKGEDVWHATAQRRKERDGVRVETYPKVGKMIYIAGPFRGENAWEVAGNVYRAKCRALEVAKLGATAICPHSMGQDFDGTLTDGYWLATTLEMMRRCDAVYADLSLPSAGTRGEVSEAERIGMPVFTTLFEVANWLQ